MMNLLKKAHEFITGQPPVQTVPAPLLSVAIKAVSPPSFKYDKLFPKRGQSQSKPQLADYFAAIFSK